MRLAFANFVFLALCDAAQGRPDGRATEVLGAATVEIIDQFFVRQAIHINIFAASTNQENENGQNDVIDYVLKKKSGSMPYQLRKVSMGSKKLSNGNLGRFHLFFVDGYKSFARIRDTLNRHIAANEEYYLIVFTSGRSWSAIENEARRILNVFWFSKVSNVYLLASVDIGEDAVAKLYTFFPYNEKKCGQVNPMVVNEYRKDGFVSELNVFVNKYKNMHQCPLNVVFFNVALLKLDKQMNLGGVDGDVLNYIAKAMNFRIEMIFTSYSERQKVLGRLSNGKTDIAIGGLTDLIVTHANYLVTYPHFHDSLGFVKPIGIPYTALEKLTMPFFSSVWVCLLVVFVVVSIVFYLIFGQPFFDQINIVMGGSLGRMPGAIRARSLISMWMFATLILRNAYQGALFDILQAQIRYHPIETVEDLARFNYAIYCPADMCKWIGDLYPHVQKQTEIIPNTEYATKLISMVKEPIRGVFVTTQASIARYNKLNLKMDEESVVLMKEKLYGTHFIMWVKTDPALVAELNFHVQNLHSNGLLKYWKDEHMRQKIIREEKTPEKLTLSHLEGIFFVCAVLYAISILVFVFELILWRIQQSIQRFSRMINRGWL